MSDPNLTTPSLRADLAEWLTQHYGTALESLRTESADDVFPNGVPPFRVTMSRQRLTTDLDRYLIDLRLETLKPAVTAGNRRGHTVTMHLVAPYEEAEQTGDLDAMLSALLDTLTTTSRGIRWTTAVYAIRDGSYPCYEITLELEEIA